MGEGAVRDCLPRSRVEFSDRLTELDGPIALLALLESYLRLFYVAFDDASSNDEATRGAIGYMSVACERERERMQALADALAGGDR